MLNDGASPTIIRCVFEGNSAGMGGGVQNGLERVMGWATPGSAPTIVGCIFTGNFGTLRGGAVRNMNDSSPTILNCAFFGNQVNDGGGAVWCQTTGTPSIVNCAFLGNVALNIGGGGIHVSDSTDGGTVTNCIFWEGAAPTGSQIVLGTGATLAVAYCDVQGGWPGNINADPLFVDPDDPDGPDDVWGTADDGVTLKPGSPCVDAADGAAAPELDILGLVRHDDPGTTDTGVGAVTHADTGAYEFQGDSSLVGWWRFDETLGTTASDSSGNGRQGTLTNMSGTEWTTGRIGGALEFDGSDDYVDCGDILNSLAVPFSFSAWVRKEGADTVSIISTDAAVNYYGFWVATDPSDGISVSWGDGTGSGPNDRRTKNSSNSIPVGTWAHVAAVVQGPTDMTIYINGSDAGGSYAGNGGPMVYSSAPCLLAKTVQTAGQYFYGALDDVRIYDRALSAAEIQALYDAGQ